MIHFLTYLGLFQSFRGSHTRLSWRRTPFLLLSVLSHVTHLKSWLMPLYSIILGLCGWGKFNHGLMQLKICFFVQLEQRKCFHHLQHGIQRMQKSQIKNLELLYYANILLLIRKKPYKVMFCNYFLVSSLLHEIVDIWSSLVHHYICSA